MMNEYLISQMRMFTNKNLFYDKKREWKWFERKVWFIAFNHEHFKDSYQELDNAFLNCFDEISVRKIREN